MSATKHTPVPWIFSKEAQLEIVEKCAARMNRAGIRFAIVAQFPEGGGAFITGDDSETPDENGENIAQSMRYYAKELRAGTFGMMNIRKSEARI